MDNYDSRIPFKKFEIGGEMFEFEVSPAACERRGIVWPGILGRLKRLEDEKGDELSTEEILGLYKKGLDAAFGCGAFERFFALCENDGAKLIGLTERLTEGFMRIGGKQQCSA